MRNLLLILLIAFMFGCSKETNHKNEIVVNKKINKFDNNVWKQYKCFRPTEILSTPYNQCYLLIYGHRYYYFKNGILEESDSIVRDLKYSFPLFRATNKTDDYIQFLDFKGDSLVIVRDNHDGKQEYFKRIETDSIPNYIFIIDFSSIPCHH